MRLILLLSVLINNCDYNMEGIEAKLEEALKIFSTFPLIAQDRREAVRKKGRKKRIV